MTYIDSVAMLGTQVSPGEPAAVGNKNGIKADLAFASENEQAASFASAYQQAQNAADKDKVGAKAQPEALPRTLPQASDEKTNIDLAEDKDAAAYAVLPMDTEETLGDEGQPFLGDKAQALPGADVPSEPTQSSSADPNNAQPQPQQTVSQDGEQSAAQGSSQSISASVSSSQSDFYQQLFAQLNASTELKTPAQTAPAMAGASAEMRALAPELQRVLSQLTPQQREQLNATLQQFAKEQNLDPQQLAALTQQLEGDAYKGQARSLPGTQGQSIDIGAQLTREPGKSEGLNIKPWQTATTLDSRSLALASSTHVSATASAAQDVELKPGDLISLTQGEEKAVGAKISLEPSLESVPRGRVDGAEGGKIPQLAQALLAQLQAGAASDVSSAIEADLAQWQQLALHTSVQTQAAAQGTALKQPLDPALLQALNITKSDAALQLHQRVNMLLNLSNQEAEIRLDPPELGSMQVRVRSEGEQAHINFVVQNQQAKEALEQSMPRLRELLAQQGLAMGEAQVEQHNQGQGHEQEAFANQSQQGLEADNQTESNGELESPSSAVKNPQAEQGIDFYA
ncbi:flagellar hook-length control protein FliK [Pseudoalteromonas sp. T1lg48]|uniref:flagellar hook-length control protein FliK n=1 Tax=Pseudoalteromonas sp. T1lg48 TaxID=2077100 RepID=UPI001F3E9123|nr:flagellar hook-length control protein FliK [Pseudoalteromonas sp. T1lg48]